MAEFIYDEMVTAQNLNEIAVDLGVGDFSVFADETPYAVGKLNEITQSLVGSGISSALNKFEITVNSENVIVGTGIAFFSSGKKLKLKMPVTLPFKSGELYLYEKQSTGVVSINIGELPADNYIHLATINEDATYTDRRTIAKAKVELPTEGSSYSFKHIITPNYNGLHFTIPIVGASKIFINTPMNNYTATLAEYDIKTQKFRGIYRDNSGNEIHAEVVAGTMIWLYFSTSANYGANVHLVTQTEESVTFRYVVEGGGFGDAPSNEVNYYVFGGVEK